MLDSDILRDIAIERLDLATRKRSSALVARNADNTMIGERAYQDLNQEAQKLERSVGILNAAADCLDADYGAMLLKLVQALEERDRAIYEAPATRYLAQAEARRVTRQARALLDEWRSADDEVAA